MIWHAAALHKTLIAAQNPEMLQASSGGMPLPYEDIVALAPVGPQPAGTPPVRQRASCGHDDDAEVRQSLNVSHIAAAY
jgi:hypothetical protein